VNWLERPTITVHLCEYFAILAWALVASALYVDRWWQCRRWHRGIGAPAGDTVRWDDQPAEQVPAGHRTRETA
jgi:hypothetical protein